MKELGWDRGQDDEELFEFAMHDKQYREYKSGLAKEQFNKDLVERMRKAGKPVPEHLLPKPETSEDELAAVAMAMHMAQQPTEAPAATLPVIRSTQWKRFNPYTL
jgi:pyruvate carboxylase subunit B